MRSVSRNLQIDLLKSISIFGVVLIHTLSFFEKESGFNLYVSSLFRFGVPCFIIIWAYYLEISFSKVTQSGIKNFILTKFKYLFKIFFIWSLLYFIIQVDGQTISLKKILTSYFLGYGWSGQYFFIILFQLLLLYPIIRFIYSNKKYRNLCIVIFSIIYLLYGYFLAYVPHFLLLIGNRLFIYWVPYVFLGIYLSNNIAVKLPILFVTSIFLILGEVLFFRYFNLKYDVYVTPVVLLSSGLLCLSILKNIFFKKTNYFTGLITYLGSNTMIVFVANPIVILLLKMNLMKHISKSLSAPEKLLYLFVLTTFIIWICLVIKEIIFKLNLNKYLL